MVVESSMTTGEVMEKYHVVAQKVIYIFICLDLKWAITHLCSAFITQLEATASLAVVYSFSLWLWVKNLCFVFCCAYLCCGCTSNLWFFPIFQLDAALPKVTTVSYAVPPPDHEVRVSSTFRLIMLLKFFRQSVLCKLQNYHSWISSFSTLFAAWMSHLLSGA